MELSEIKPGMKVVCRRRPDDLHRGPGWNPSMDKTIGIELTVEYVTRDYVKCKFDNPGGLRDWWCYNAEWLEPYKGLKVGDYVICKEKAHWGRTMDRHNG